LGDVTSSSLGALEDHPKSDNLLAYLSNFLVVLLVETSLQL